jgi:eukaryotic-like serine/threonine-protein kinase
MGKVLGGRYEVLKQLAAGGMATVHLGRALGVGGFERLVAIKVMHPHIAAEPEFVTMFLDEARLAARIRHPNVVPTLDVQESPDGLFLIMEYIEGASLHHLLKAAGNKPGGMPLPVVLRMMVDTLSGLHGAHELSDDDGLPLSLVHRDISPVNILLGTDGVARITDFGVARAEARLSSTRGGQLKGKVPYMPPEQIMNEGIDRRCDIYAAGAVLWESLVGRRLFQAESDGAMLQRILAGPHASPRQIDATIPEAIDRACMRALHKDPGARFATAAEFSEAIEQAALEAGVAIASGRVVATFVAESGAYKKLQPKELAALKAPLSSRTPSTTDPAALPIVAADAPKSSPTAPSQVTSAGSAVSAAHEPPRRLGAIAAVAGVALAIALGVLWLRSGSPAPTSEPAAPQPSVSASASAELAPPVASPAASPAPIAVASASASASAVPRPAAVSATPRPPPARPKPASTVYDPERL